MSNLDVALKIAVEAHAGQTDRDGEAYILHPLTVGLMGKTDEERMAGFLHDVLEDTPLTAEDLLERGIPEGVVGALRLLTHDKSLSYDEYVQRIIDSHNPIALKVKYNDLQHNFATRVTRSTPSYSPSQPSGLPKVIINTTTNRRVAVLIATSEQGNSSSL